MIIIDNFIEFINANIINKYLYRFNLDIIFHFESLICLVML